MTATIAEIELAADEFALSHVGAQFDDLQYQIEQVVAYDTDHVMPYVWISGPSIQKIDTALQDDESVKSADVLAELEDERLYQMDWISRIETLVQILVEEEGTILSAEGNSEHWTLRILFPTRDALSRTYDYCESQGLYIEIQTVYNIDDGRQGRFGLTDSQQDALSLAFEHGYYDIPRENSMTELAKELNISHQALSERLRRAHQTLVENAVVIGRADHREQRGI